MEEPKLTRSEYYAQFKGAHKVLDSVSYPSYEEYIMDFEGAKFKYMKTIGGRRGITITDK